MTTQIDAVLIKLNATTDQLRSEMGKARNSVRRSASDMKRDLSGLKRSFSSAFAPLIGGLGGATIAAGVVSVGLQTEKLRASLETVTGSAVEANKAFEEIKDFTASTPFQITQVADAFIKLSAYGIQPTNELLSSLGNTASAMGKSLDQAVEALADATTGEFERLKEFGIRASTAGDRVSFTFRGVTTEVGKNADEIRRYLQSIGETDFAGAMERQTNTLGGAFSNLQDSVFNLADEFGRDSGLIQSLADATRGVTSLLNAIDGGDNVFVRFGKGIGIAIAELQVGSATVIGQRRERLEALEAEAASIERRIRRAGPNASDEDLAQSREQLRLLRERIRLLKELFAQTPAGSIPPITIGGGTETSPGRSNRQSTPTGPTKAELKAIDDYRKSLRSLIDGLDPAERATREYTEAVALLDRAVFDGTISFDRHDELMMSLAEDTEAAAEQARALADEQKRLAEEARRTDEHWRDLGMTFSSAFEDAIVEGKKLSEVVNALGEDITRIIVRRSFTEPLANSVSGALSGLDISSIFGGFFADGGSVRGNVPIVVGEKGPELFVPSSAGTIVPNKAMSGSMAMGGEVTVNVINNAAGTQATARSRSEGGNRVVDIMIEQVKNSIAGDIARGAGSLPSVLERTYGVNRVAGAT